MSGDDVVQVVVALVGAGGQIGAALGAAHLAGRVARSRRHAIQGDRGSEAASDVALIHTEGLEDEPVVDPIARAGRATRFTAGAPPAALARAIDPVDGIVLERLR